jgi:hypothetical protein
VIELTRGQMVALFYNSNTDEIERVDTRDIADDARAGAPGR